jgi:ketosteroid isomerase-like protein
MHDRKDTLMPAASMIAEYFRHLDEGDAAGAAALFSADAVYIRPVLDDAGVPMPELAVVEGRGAIEQYFVDRGLRPYRHVVRATALENDREFLEGYVDATVGRTAFLATATLDAEGRIARYFATATGVTTDNLALLGRAPVPN